MILKYNPKAWTDIWVKAKIWNGGKDYGGSWDEAADMARHLMHHYHELQVRSGMSLLMMMLLFIFHCCRWFKENNANEQDDPRERSSTRRTSIFLSFKGNYWEVMASTSANTDSVKRELLTQHYTTLQATSMLMLGNNILNDTPILSHGEDGKHGTGQDDKKFTSPHSLLWTKGPDRKWSRNKMPKRRRRRRNVTQPPPITIDERDARATKVTRTTTKPATVLPYASNIYADGTGDIGDRALDTIAGRWRATWSKKTAKWGSQNAKWYRVP